MGDVGTDEDLARRLASMACWGIPADSGSFGRRHVTQALESLELEWRRAARRTDMRPFTVTPLDVARALLTDFEHRAVGR